MTRTYTGSFTHNGQHLTFRVEAPTHDQAEAMIEDIGSSGRIDGELVDEGECDGPFTIGTA